jgi:tetratricopeptide (TPR) repeat protein
MDYAKSLLNTGKYEECLSVLVRTQVLPYEGASEGHELYRRAGILAAAESLRLGNLKRAETLALKAKEWPENLGVGRPNDVDERLEDFVAALAYEKLGDKKKADEAYQAVAAAADKFRTKWDSLHLASAIALKKIGKGSDAIRLIADWRKNRPAADPVPDWGSAVFQDDPDRVQEILIQMAVGPRAEKYRNGDRNFPLMLKVMEAAK